MMGKLVDVEITDVYPNSLRGKVVRTEDKWVCAWQKHEIGHCPYRKENDLGVGYYQP